MSINSRKTPVDVPSRVVGEWKETYQWIPIFGAVAAFAAAFSAGANNLPASFSIPIGSRAITFLKASIVACMIYVPGAGFASHNNVNSLFSDFLKEKQPDEGFLMWSMVVVLITTTLWLSLATYFELPVSSQQSTQGALLGTMLVTEGFTYIPLWNKSENQNFKMGGIIRILLEWTVAPLISCACAFCLFVLLKSTLLRNENAEKRILILLPIYYGVAVGLLCVFVMYQVIPKLVIVSKWISIVAIVVSTLIGTLLSLVVVVPLARRRFSTAQALKDLKRKSSVAEQWLESQEQLSNAKIDEKDSEEKFEEVLKDFMQMRVLDTVYEVDERSRGSPETIVETENITESAALSITEQSTALKELLESTPNRLIRTRNFQKIKKITVREKLAKFIQYSTKSSLFPDIKYDRHTLIRHALAEKFDDVEDFFGFPLLLASCIFALIQSATEVANLVSPVGAIYNVFMHRAKYSGNGEDVGSLYVSWWFRALGGLSVSMGFFLCGWRLTQCLGSKVTYISNSRGMTSQVSALAAVIIVYRLKLPVSSVHSFVGSLVGVGVADDPRNVNWKLLVKFLFGWVFTNVFCCSFAYGMYYFSVHSPGYVVP